MGDSTDNDDKKAERLRVVCRLDVLLELAKK